MNTRQHTLTTLIVFLALVAACGRGGGDNKPSVRILSPLDQHAIMLGETVKVESRANDDKGVSQIELHIDGIQVELADVPKGEKSYRVEQSWLPPDAGVYQVTVIAHDTKGQPSEPATISISVRPAPTPTPGATPSPTATPPLSPTAGQGPLGANGCTYEATFVSDVTIPDNTPLAPATEFVKTWRMRNSGTCDWGPGIQFVFVDGERMGAPASVNVPSTPADNTVDISVTLQAPPQTGTYSGIWRIRTPDGKDFGDRPYLQIVVSTAATVTPSATPTTTAAPKPDLDITLISGNLELLVGERLKLRVTIRNQGTRATDRLALVRAVLGAGLEIESSVPSLPAGGEQVVILDHSFDAPADLVISISVDPDDEIAEEDEANNSERVAVIANPPLYATGTVTATRGVSFDLDDGSSEPERLDIEWRVVEGSVFVGLLNNAGAAPLGKEIDGISYALAAALTWATEQLTLIDLAEGSLFGLRTNEGRIGFARVDEVPDDARTNARLTYFIWDWP